MTTRLTDRARAIAAQFRSHPVSRGIDEIEAAGEMLYALADELERLRAQALPTVEDINAQRWAGMDGTTAYHLIERHGEDWWHCGRLMEAWRAANAAAPAAEAPSLTVGERADGLTEEQIVTFLDAFQNDRKLLGDYEAFAGTARDIWAAALAPAAQAEPVAWRYRHILNTLNPAVPEAITEWRPVEPRDCLQTLEQRIAELRAYRYDGRPCYEVQALYAAPSNPPAQGVDINQLEKALERYWNAGFYEGKTGDNAATEANEALSTIRSLFRAAIAQAPAAEPQWWPIETAPKDGRDLLLWESGSSVPVVASWRDGRRAGWHATTEHYNTDGDACVIDTLWQDGITHWMPIPATPTAQTAQEGQKNA